MSDCMNKKMVELYCLRVLPPQRQRQVEQAFDEDPQVQAWFLELGELPEHVRAEDDELLTDMILEDFAQYRGALANEHDRALFAEARRAAEIAAAPTTAETSVAGVAVNSSQESPAHLIAQWSELISACLADQLSAVEQGCARLCKVLDDVAHHTPGSVRCTLDFTEVMSLADGNARTYPMALAEDMARWEEMACRVVDRSISICIPTENAPHGLVWLAVEEANDRHTVTMHLPRLELVAGSWVGNDDIRDVLQGRTPVAEVTVRIIPATEINREAFVSDRVREFVDEELDLPEHAEQRVRARAFLGMEGTSR